jgi:hypothetical protein
MMTRRIVYLVLFLIALPAAAASVSAQQPQIPTLQVCNKTGVSGKALVKITSRADGIHSGGFLVEIDLKCENTGYPAGVLQISNLSMSDSIIQNTIVMSTFEQLTSTGKHTPTAFVNGRCKAANISGCRYWMMLADNKPSGASGGTPDIISFLVLDGTGKRVAYGTGPVVDGDIDVVDTPN